MQTHRVLIATPIYRSIAASCHKRMLDTVERLRRREDVCREWLHCVGPEVRRNRNLITATALRMPEWTHILWLDGDCAIGVGVLDLMLSFDQDILGAGYPMRGRPEVFVARSAEGHVPSSWRGLRTVEWTGAGVLLVKRDVFLRLPAPWWRNEFIPGEIDQTPEDVGFCLHARKAGYKIWLLGVDGVEHLDIVEREELPVCSRN